MEYVAHFNCAQAAGAAPKPAEPRLPTDDPEPLSLEPAHRRSQIHLVNPGDPRAPRLETDGVPGWSSQAVVDTRTVVSSHLIQGTLALCACPP